MTKPSYTGNRMVKFTLKKAYPNILGDQLVPVSTILAQVVGIRENWHTFLAV
jgi:hypothetical protein